MRRENFQNVANKFTYFFYSLGVSRIMNTKLMAPWKSTCQSANAHKNKKLLAGKNKRVQLFFALNKKAILMALCVECPFWRVGAGNAVKWEIGNERPAQERGGSRGEFQARILRGQCQPAEGEGRAKGSRIIQK